MSDDNVPVSTRANLPDHVGRMQDLLDGVANIATSIADAGGVASGLPFIGLNNDGRWAFGQERTEAEEGSPWAVDIRTLTHGYIAWPDQKSKDRKPLGERMVPANSPLPPLNSLPDVGVPYALQFGFEMFCLGGEDEGTVAIYKNGSHGGKKLVQTLVDNVRKQARLDPDRLCPVVTLETSSYESREWRKTIYNPEFRILRWISYDDYDDAVAGVPAEPDAPAPEPVAAPPRPQEAALTPQPKAAARGNGRPNLAAVPEPAAPTPTPAPARRRRPQPAA